MEVDSPREAEADAGRGVGAGVQGHNRCSDGNLLSWLGASGFTKPPDLFPCDVEGCVKPARPCSCGPHTSARPHKYTAAALATHMLKHSEHERGIAKKRADKRKWEETRGTARPSRRARHDGSGGSSSASTETRSETRTLHHVLESKDSATEGAATSGHRVRKTTRDSWSAVQKVQIVDLYAALRTAAGHGLLDQHPAYRASCRNVLSVLNYEIQFVVEGCEGKFLNRSMVTRWSKPGKYREMRDKIERGYGDGCRASFGRARFAGVDEAVIQRVAYERSQGYRVSNGRVGEMSREEAAKREFTAFQGSRGYIARFKKRAGLHVKAIANTKEKSAAQREPDVQRFLQGLILLNRGKVAAPNPDIVGGAGTVEDVAVPLGAAPGVAASHAAAPAPAGAGAGAGADGGAPSATDDEDESSDEETGAPGAAMAQRVVSARAHMDDEEKEATLVGSRIRWAWEANDEVGWHDAIVLDKVDAPPRRAGGRASKYGKYRVLFLTDSTYSTVNLASRTVGDDWEILPDIPVDDALAAVDHDDGVLEEESDADEEPGSEGKEAEAQHQADVDVAGAAAGSAADPAPLARLPVPENDPRWGRFTLDRRLNVDQVPLVVEDGKGTTNVMVGEDAHVKVPKAWADRQGSLQILIGADGMLYDICLIFVGASAHKLRSRPGRPARRQRHIREQVGRASARGVHVIFQEKAWCDGAAAQMWATNVLPKCLGVDVPGSYACQPGEEVYLLVLDNLGGQAAGVFHRVCRERACTLVWMLPPNCTDLLQPVDSNIGKLIKDSLKKKYRAFMRETHAIGRTNLSVACDDVDETDEAGKAAKKLLNSSHFRREKLIEWTAEVVHEWRTVPRYKGYIARAFEKTGIGIAVDGSNWASIKPERMPEFAVHDPE